MLQTGEADASALRDLSEKFWSKVRRVRGYGCWLWQGRRQPSGYGTINLLGREVGAHRAAFELAGGTLLPGQVVMHLCDTPLCVRPGHLRAGTASQNRYDCIRKNRHAKAERNGRAKLRPADVLAIRELGHLGTTELARRYGVDRKAIYQILHGMTWKSIKGAQR